MEDAAIIRLYFSRDEAAITETGKKYGVQLLRLSRNITGNGADAEECVNDAYFAVWRRIPPEEPQNLYAYLCRVTRNISLDCLDRRCAAKRSAPLLPLEEELAQAIPAQTPDFATEEMLSALLNEFLGNLEKGTRLLFVRRYFYGDTVESLCAMSGLKENSVYARLHRARERLRKMLAGKGIVV